MKLGMFICIILFSIISMNSCGISRQEYENLKAERDKLMEELELFRYGESRLVALVFQDLENKNISSARRNVNLLNQYHPESISKQENKHLLNLVEVEEANIARLAAEREAAERAAMLERQQGFENRQAANASVLTLAEADLMRGNRTLTNGSFYIIRGFFAMESGGRVTIGEARSRLSDGTFWVHGNTIFFQSNRLLSIPAGTSIIILARAIDGNFELIEWQRR